MIDNEFPHTVTLAAVCPRCEVLNKVKITCKKPDEIKNVVPFACGGCGEPLALRRVTEVEEAVLDRAYVLDEAYD